MNKLNPESGSAGGVALPENVNPEGRAKRPAEPLPKREKLPHEIPSWVNQGARHFITINCKHRNHDELTGKAGQLLESALYYEQNDKWHLWLMVVMPDHIHFIATFDLQQGIKPTISAWKSYQTKTLGIKWQSDFFEHRLRNQSEFDEKCHYIRTNPLRAGLIADSEDWPHVLDRISIDGGSAGGVAPPNDATPEGGAKRPAEPLSRNNGSAGGVAPPKDSQET